MGGYFTRTQEEGGSLTSPIQYLPEEVWKKIVSYLDIVTIYRSLRFVQTRYLTLTPFQKRNFTLIPGKEKSRNYYRWKVKDEEQLPAKVISTSYGPMDCGIVMLAATEGEHFYWVGMENARVVRYRNLRSGVRKEARINGGESAHPSAMGLGGKGGKCFVGCPSTVYCCDFSGVLPDGVGEFNEIFKAKQERKEIECFVGFGDQVIAVDNILITKYGWVFDKGPGGSLVYRDAVKLGSGVYLHLINAAASEELLVISGSTVSGYVGSKALLFFWGKDSYGNLRSLKNWSTSSREEIQHLAVLKNVVYFAYPDRIGCVASMDAQSGGPTIVLSLKASIIGLRNHDDVLYVFAQKPTSEIEILVFFPEANGRLSFLFKNQVESLRDAIPYFVSTSTCW